MCNGSGRNGESFNESGKSAKCAEAVKCKENL